jgi:nucleotide-binding universal stress UspA family protein
VDAIEAARDAVVVGVEDSSGSRSAVLWAAEEARLRRLNLLIVHVGTDGHTRDRDAALTREVLLNTSAQAASRREPTVIVGTLLLSGQPGERLLELTQSAAILVVGSRPGRSWLGRNPANLTRRLTSGALCDVVTVSRVARVRSAGVNQVLAVWSSNAARDGVLRAAADEAVLRRADLRLAVPVLGDASGTVTPVGDDDLLAADLERLRSRYPALDLTVDWIDPASVVAMGDALRGCHLAVLGYGQDGSATSRAADLADGLLRQASCPLFFAANHQSAARPALPSSDPDSYGQSTARAAPEDFAGRPWS